MRANKLDPATAETEAGARLEQLIELLRGLRLGGRKQLPEGTSVRLASTRRARRLRLRWRKTARHVRMHALFTIRRLISHDPDITMMDLRWNLPCWRRTSASLLPSLVPWQSTASLLT